MNKSVIIVAAGSGLRMGSSIPKQFIVIQGKPILMHTIQRFYTYDSDINIIVVLPDGEKERWNSLLEQYSFPIKHKIVSGGETRFDSVLNGLKEVENGIVGVHDGVRPLISSELISRCFSEAEKFSNAIPAIPVTDTIRETGPAGSKTIDRSNLRQVQTPQCFDVAGLKKAYANAKAKNFTDDAGVFENDGNSIHLIPGEKRNIKITDPDDLVIAAAVMASGSQLLK